MNKWIKKGDLKDPRRALKRELDQCFEKHRDMLDDIQCEQRCKTLAVLLENQDLFNIRYEYSVDLNFVKEVYSKFRVPDWVEFWPMLYPSANFPVECFAKTRALKSRPANYNAQDELAAAIRLELESEVYNDLRNNAQRTCTLTYSEEDWETRLRNRIDWMYFATPLWSANSITLIVPTSLKDYVPEKSRPYIKTDFIDVNSNTLILTSKTDDVNRNYFYNTYVPFAKLKEGVFLTRYAKHLTKDRSFLSALKIEGIK